MRSEDVNGRIVKVPMLQVAESEAYQLGDQE